MSPQMIRTLVGKSPLRKALLLGAALALQAPGLPASARSATAQPAGQPALLLTARPGTTARYTQTSQTTFRVLEFRLEAKPGQSVKAAELAAANRQLDAQRAQMKRAMNGAAMTQRSTLIMRVLPSSGGDASLLTQTSLRVPDAAHPGRQKAADISVTTSYDPAGRLLDVQMSSNDPALQQVFKALDLKALMSSVQSSGTSTLYGQPLRPGHFTSATVSVPMQGLFQSLSGLAGGMARDKALNISGDVSGATVSPLVMHTTTGYGGQDARGNLVFSQKLSADPWRFALNAGGVSLKMNVVALTGGGGSVMRPDGLPESSQLRQDMTLQMQADLPDQPYRLTAQLIYSTSSAVTPAGR